MCFLSLSRETKVVRRLAAYLPFAARQGSRAREWLSFLVLAVSDARPPSWPHPATTTEPGDPSAGRGRVTGKRPAASSGDGGDGDVSPLAALVRAAAAAVAERMVALANHPNAALYASIARLIPGAGQFLELEPCLVCPAQEKGGEGKGATTVTAAAAAAVESQSHASAGAAAGTRAGAAAAAVAAAAGAGAGASAGTGAGLAGAGGGRGLVYLNYPLDSIKASTKSTENAMLVGC